MANRLVYCAVLLAPSLAICSPVRFRHAALVTTLFALATLGCLFAGQPDLRIGLGDLSGIGGALALLHPVMLAAALSNGAPREQRPASTWRGVFPARTSLLGLWLGLPMMTWLSTTFVSPWIFQIAAAVTAVIGAAILLRDDSRLREPPRLQDTHLILRPWRHGTHRIAVIWRPAVAIALQYAALFAGYSHSHLYLESSGRIDAQMSAFLMVIFGMGGVFGALVVSRWMQHFTRTLLCLHPMALAAAYVLLYVLGREPGMGSFFVVAFWGAVHTTGMLLSRLLLGQAYRNQRDSMAWLHVTMAAGGAVAGITLSQGLYRGFGPDAIVMCGAVLSFLTFVAVGSHVAQHTVTRSIVARSHTE